MAKLVRQRAGQDFTPSAGTWNRFCDATEWIEKQGVLGRGGDTRPDLLTAELLIRVQNNSGVDVERFGVLAIDGPVFDPTDDDALPGFLATPIVKGVKPTLSDWGQFVIAVEPIANGLIGNAVICGVVPCQVNILKAGHRWADVKADAVDVLNSDDAGNARIIVPTPSTGIKWVYALIGSPSTSGFCATQETIAANSSGNIKYSDDVGTTWGGNVPARYVANDGNPSILNGTVCYRYRIANGWCISPVGCDE